MCCKQAPPFYDKDIPPAPPGLIWWELLADVPPLPTPQKYFHDKTGNYSRFGWHYDPNFQFNDYQFSNMDLTTMTNVKQHDRKLWVHVASVWVITWYVWRVSRRICSPCMLPCSACLCTYVSCALISVDVHL